MIASPRPAQQLTLGVIGKSSKPDEKRLPIHPRHFDRIDPGLRQSIILEQGYGDAFGFSNQHLDSLVGRLCPREQLIASADVVLLPKPQAEDLAGLRDGQVLWGWPHCVQDRALTQLAIDHSPSYLWDSATWEISEALIPFISTVMAGPPAWDLDEPISRAIEIRNGHIQNPDILEFQNRSAAYPHESR